MNEPKRLLDEGASDFERELLSASSYDAGSRRAFSRTQAAVRLIAGGLATTAVTSTATGAATAGTIGALLKWTGAGIVAGVVLTSGASAVIAPPGPRGEGNQAPVQTAPVASASAEPEPLLAPPAPPEPKAEPTTQRVLRPGSDPAARAPAATAAPAAPPASAVLAEETRLIAAAAARQRSGDGAGALQLLDQYTRRFPTGTLRPEADVVRVRALVLAGRSAEAATLARRADPSSAHGRAIQQALGKSSASK